MADAPENYEFNKHRTCSDYKVWELKPGERYEIIYGEAYAMSAPNTYHRSILTELLKQKAVFLTGKPGAVVPGTRGLTTTLYCCKIVLNGGYDYE